MISNYTLDTRTSGASFSLLSQFDTQHQSTPFLNLMMMMWKINKQLLVTVTYWLMVYIILVGLLGCANGQDAPKEKRKQPMIGENPGARG